MERRMPRKYSSPVVKLASNSPKRTISFCISDLRHPRRAAAHELGRSRAVWLKLPRAEAPSDDIFLTAGFRCAGVRRTGPRLAGELIEVSDGWGCSTAGDLSSALLFSSG